jgi:hypothetical protein
MSHAVGNHISTQTALRASNVVFTQIIAPRIDGPISKGVAGTASQALATNRTPDAFSSTTMNDNTVNPWTGISYVGHIVVITAGTAAGDVRLITANTADQITVDTDFSATPDATSRFDIREPSRITPIIRGWTLDHTAIASILRLRTKGLVNGTMTTRTLLMYNPGAATSGIGSASGYSFFAIPGGEVRAEPTVNNMAGTVTMDAFWVNDNITALIDD